MRISSHPYARAVGLLCLSLGLAACSSPTPSRPQDNAPAVGGGGDVSGTPGASSSDGSFRTDPISGGPEVWDTLYPPESTADPEAPYPPPAPTDEPYPAPGDDDGETTPPADADAATPTAVPTKSGG